MNTHADKIRENKFIANANSLTKRQGKTMPGFQLKVNLPEPNAEKERKEAINNSLQVKQMRGSEAGRFTPMGTPVATGGRSNTIQRYTVSKDKKYNVSENNKFAVPKEEYPKAIFSKNEEPIPLKGGLKWINTGTSDIDERTYSRYEADISDYEKREGPGSKKFCGEFARGLTGRVQEEDQSTSEPGGTLYDKDTSPGLDTGWENHYAAVVIVDGSDHGSFETAVGIDHVWAGIYGVERGQTFKYKTQEANIERLMNMPDFVIPAKTAIEKTFWDYVLCRPGKRVIKSKEIRVPQGVSIEDGMKWKTEMEEWRKSGKRPESEYMKKVIIKLEAELEKLEK